MKLYQNSNLDTEFLYSQCEPLVLFDNWYNLAVLHEINDPNAMSLATVCSRGMPDVRIVLLKGHEDLGHGNLGHEDLGFRFFTNYESKKSDDLHHNPYGCINFHWKSLRRQIRLRGRIKKLSADESDAYFLSRPLESQISAWASFQSSVMNNDDDFARRKQKFSEFFRDRQMSRPPFWGGYSLFADMMEFWIGDDARSHDRVVFDRMTNGEKNGEKWHKRRFYP